MEIVAPGLKQCAEGDADVHEDDEEGEQRAEDRERDRDAPVLNQHSLAGSLAGEGRGALGLEVVLLHDEHEERDGEEDDRHRGGAFLVVGSGDLQVDGRRQRVVGAADDHRVREVGDGLDEGDEKCISETRQNQRQGDGAKDRPSGSAHVAGGLLEGGVYIFKKSPHHHVADREKCQRLDDRDAPESVDVVVIDVQQKTGDDAGLSEEHDHGEGKDEGRRDDRQHGDDLEEAGHEAGLELYIDFHVGEEKADERGGDTDQKAYF